MVRVMPAAIAIEVTSEQQRELQRIVTAKTSSQRDVFRARIILGLTEGLSHEEISREQGVSLLAIGRWRKRWASKGLEGLRDAPGRGRKPTMAATAIRSALSLAARQAPGGGAWSVRTMARETGLSKSSVQRLWSAHAIAPHRPKASNFPRTWPLKRNSGMSLASISLVNTEFGDTFTFAEMSAWLREAGYVNPRLLDVPSVSPLILADKPR